MLPLLLSALVHAASYDPALVWRTLRTEHFAITFHDGEEQLADEMAVSAERAWDILTVEIGTAPTGRVELALVDFTDSSNGYATIVPQNTIVIFVTAPEEDSTLALYEDWSSAIVTHELTHILHISTVEGLPRLARLLMGSYVSTHQQSPGWIVEGYATFEETRMTNAGRGRHAAVDMVKRAAVLEDHFPPLGNMDGFQALPPGGNLRYLFGQDFIQFIADTTGREKWTEWVHRYGRSIPYFLPAKRTFGKSFVKLYREWKVELKRRYGAQAAAVEAEGKSELKTLSAEGLNCGAPAWKPDGTQLAYSCSDPKRGNAIWLADAATGETKIAVKDKFARNIAWRSDGEAFAYSAMHTVKLYSTFEDVSLFDMESKRSRTLTSGARARDPSFSPDGTRMLVVTNGAQNNQLEVLTVDQQLRPLTQNTDHTQYGTPRYSPDGSSVALSVWRDGMRDLWIYTTDGRPWRRLTWDTAIDREPAWSADGAWLYFTSDRSGIPNIYAVEVATERLYRVTNVVTGVWGPSPHPDGTLLACQLFTTAGARIATMALEPAKFKDLGLLPRWPGEDRPMMVEGNGTTTVVHWSETRWVRADGTVTSSTPELESESRVRVRLPSPSTSSSSSSTPDPTAPAAAATPYNPLATLFPPRFWFPGLFLTQTGGQPGLFAIASTSGSDILHHYGYSAYATYRTDARFLGGGASFTVNKWRPIFQLGGSTSVSPYGDIFVATPLPDGGGASLPSVESALRRYWDRRVRLSAVMSYPLSEHASLNAYYQATIRSPLDALPADVYLPALPTRGFFSTLGAGWRWGKGTSYPLSVSPEVARGLAIAAELTPAVLGSWTYDDQGQKAPFNQLQTTAEWREYVTNPLIPNHVLATKLSGGATLGDRFNYGSFRLGGSFSEGGITVVPSEWRMLRGFFPASDSGEWYWLGSLEYRFPLWNIDRGVGTLPLFARNVSGAVILDAGNAFDDADGVALGETLVGTGAELRFQAVLGYGYGIFARVGYAFAAHGDGIPLGDVNGLYAVLGSSF